MRRHGRGIYAHGAELGHLEERIVPAHPVRPVEDRSPRGELNQRGDHQHRYGEAKGRQQRASYVKEPFHRLRF